MPASSPVAPGLSPRSRPSGTIRRLLDDRDDLVERIKWTTFARTVALTALLALTIALDLGFGPQPLAQTPEVLLYKLESGFFVLTFLALLLTYFAPRRWLVGTAWLSLAIDVSLASTLVAVTDRTQSVFLFAMPLSVLSGAALLERRGAVIGASLGSAAVALLAAIDLGWLEPWGNAFSVAWVHSLAPPRPPSVSEVAIAVLVQVAALYATALLSSKLVAELARARTSVLREQREFAALRQRYEDVFSSMPDGLLTVSEDGVIRSANAAALKILRRSAADLISAQIHDVLPELAEASGSMHSTQEIARGQEPTTELWRAATGGGQQILAVRTERLRGLVAELRGQVETLYVIRDITELRAREIEHRNRERLAGIGAMAMAVAHEIRNPLASISGAVQMLGGAVPADAGLDGLVAIVQRETEQLSRWIGEFLEFAKPTRPSVAKLDLVELLNGKIDAWQADPRLEGSSIAAERRISARDGVLFADIHGLSSLIWNLLVNAQQAAIESVEPRVRVTLRDAGDDLELIIEDSGPGIEPSELPHLFEPFYTTRSKGTGLGLAMVHRVVENHRGSILVGRSDLGGALFSVVLPRDMRRRSSMLAGP